MPGGTEADGPGHPVGNFRNERRDIEMPLHARLEISHLFRARGMLQVIKRAAISDCRDQSAKLQRSHGDALAERAHFPYTAKLGRNLFVRIRPELLPGNVVPGQFTESVLMSVIGDLFETKFATESFEVCIVRMSQRHG